VAAAGVLVLLSDKLGGGQWRAGGGDLVLRPAAPFFSYCTVASKPLIERHGAVMATTYATLLGAAPVVALNLPAGLTVDWAHVPALIWAATLWAVLVSAFPGWLVWGYGQRHSRRGPHGAADVPGAAGGRPRRLVVPR
jgi:drug/metabolite transporter (DMT)-like permease